MLTLEHILKAKELLDANKVPYKGRVMWGSGAQLKELNPNLDLVDSGIYQIDSDGNIERLG